MSTSMDSSVDCSRLGWPEFGVGKFRPIGFSDKVRTRGGQGMRLVPHPIPHDQFGEKSAINGWLRIELITTSDQWR